MELAVLIIFAGVLFGIIATIAVSAGRQWSVMRMVATTAGLVTYAAILSMFMLAGCNRRHVPKGPRVDYPDRSAPRAKHTTV